MASAVRAANASQYSKTVGPLMEVCFLNFMGGIVVVLSFNSIVTLNIIMLTVAFRLVNPQNAQKAARERCAVRCILTRDLVCI